MTWTTHLLSWPTYWSSFFYWFRSSWKFVRQSGYWSKVVKFGDKWEISVDLRMTSTNLFLSWAGSIGPFCPCRWYWWSWYSIGSQFLVWRRKTGWWSSQDEQDWTSGPPASYFGRRGEICKSCQRPLSSLITLLAQPLPAGFDMRLQKLFAKSCHYQHFNQYCSDIIF